MNAFEQAVQEIRAVSAANNAAYEQDVLKRNGPWTPLPTLPSNDAMVLVTMTDGSERFFALARYRRGRWECDDERIGHFMDKGDFRILAWMPLPPLYEESHS